ncbi:MAG: hypothetical protein ABFC98_08460 [Candidatus Cloacimonas sp.]
MKKIFSVILIVVSLFLGYLGIKDYRESKHSVNVLGIELKAEDNTGKESAYIELGLAVASLIGGLFLLKNDNKK